MTFYLSLVLKVEIKLVFASHVATAEEQCGVMPQPRYNCLAHRGYGWGQFCLQCLSYVFVHCDETHFTPAPYYH